MDVWRMSDKKSNDGGVIDNFADATMLHNTHELHNDGGCDATTMALQGMRELRGDGRRQREERRAVA